MGAKSTNGFIILICLLTSLASPAWAVKLFVIVNEPAADQTERLVSAVPYDNQTVAAPTSVTLTFSRPVRPDKSSIRIRDAYGFPHGDGAITGNGATISASFPALPPGRYSVRWRTRCLCDDDSDLGDEFHFTVK